ncbi:AAA family ATPase [Cyanobacteria bacterium FACHB-472]|nr:AAA family ATPase [Cyanobacteria bacterium FACHB-472]
MSVNVETIQASSSNSLLPPVPKELVLLTVPPLTQKPTPPQIAELAAASEQNGWAYGIEEATAALAVFRFTKPKSDSKPALLILENEEAVLDAREMGIAAIAIPASFKNSVPFIQKVAAELRDDKLGCLIYLGTHQTETIEQACGNAGVPFIALHPNKLFSPLPNNPTIGDLLDKMNPSQFVQKVQALLQQTALEESGSGGKISRETARKKARKVLLSNASELDINLELENIREACGMGSYDWERKMIRPLRKELGLGRERFKLELLALQQMPESIERMWEISRIACEYRVDKATVKECLNLMKVQTQTAETRSYDLEELFDLEAEDLSWIVPGILPEGETIILSGSPKTGKTLIAIDLAFAVATGESQFLGENVKQGRVLIVQADESPQSTKKKLKKRGFRRHDKKKVRVLPKWNISQMDVLVKEIENFQPSVVIVDSLQRINHGSTISENSAEYADRIYTLKETFQRFSTAGVLIHHNNKNHEALGVDRLRGSTAIAGACWGVATLDHIPKPSRNNKKQLIIDPKDPNRILSIFARDAEGQSLRVELNLEDNSWIKHGEVGESEEQHVERQNMKERILSILEKNSRSHPQGLTGVDIIRQLDMTPTEGRGVYQTLQRLLADEKITLKDAPGNNRANFYSLAIGSGKYPTNPPPPPNAHQNVEYCAESIDISGLDDTQQNTQQILNKYSTTFEDLPTVEYSNPDISMVVADTQQVQQKQGGSGVEHEVELDKNSSPTPKNEVVDCGAENEFTEAEVKACVAELNLAIEENDPRVGNAVLIEFATLPEQLKVRVLSKLSSRIKAAIKQMQRQAEAKVGDKCQVLQLKESGDVWADVKQVWVDAVLFSFPGGGQRCWGFEVDGKNIGIHGRDEWRLVDEVQNE